MQFWKRARFDYRNNSQKIKLNAVSYLIADSYDSFKTAASNFVYKPFVITIGKAAKPVTIIRFRCKSSKWWRIDVIDGKINGAAALLHW